MTKLMAPFIKFIFLIGMLLWTPLQSRSAEVIVEPFGYEDRALVFIEEGDTFIICECPEPPSLKLHVHVPALALKTMARTPEIAMTPEKDLFEPRVFTVHFGFDSAVVTEYGQERLSEILKKIEALPGDKQIALVGHTCNIGDATYNDNLSLQRALAVKSLLESQGLSIDTAKGRGSCCPVSNENRLNRRVEIFVKPFIPKGDQS